MGRWTFDPVITAVLVVLLMAYLTGVRAARRHGGWPPWRTAAFVIGGLGGTAVCTMSWLAVEQRVHLWALGVQLTVLVSLVPVGFALGEPVGLARAALGDVGRARLDRALASPVVRVLTFPLVAAVLATTFLCVVFLTGVLEAALRHHLVMDGVYLVALVVGGLTALPLLGVELLPAWCTDPFRLLFAFVDGLLDALPGILVLSTGARLAHGWYAGRPGDPDWDVHVAGALMIALSELVALPLFFIVFFRWAARETAADRSAADRSAAADAGERRTGAVTGEPERLRPWWETEGFGRGEGRR